VGFVVDKVALGQVFSEYFGFPCQSSFHQLFHNHPHLSSGVGTIGQKWAQYKGLSPTPLAIINKNEMPKYKPECIHYYKEVLQKRGSYVSEILSFNICQKNAPQVQGGSCVFFKRAKIFSRSRTF
jgi:hypothetical protein